MVRGEEEMSFTANTIHLMQKFSIQTGRPVGQCRAVPISLGRSDKKFFLLAYAEDFDVDPFVEMFFFPKDTLKLMVISEDGEVVWRKDLGRGIIPGLWFCPVLAFDLDSDGIDEVWFVGNTNADHPLGVSNYTLECLDGRTGEFLRRMPWPHTKDNYWQQLSNQFRNFILGGYVHGKPRLITVQGTYQDMFFECFDEKLEPIWESIVREHDPGARGSHMCPIIDLNADGVDELLWGERCIDLETGRQLFCADEETYHGHSDIAAPFWSHAHQAWYFLCCRETHPQASPRICMYDARGQRVWGQLEDGHIDLGWIATLGENYTPYAMGIKIGDKVCGPDGRHHSSYSQHLFNAMTGEEKNLNFSVYKTLPVDLDGDGYHELVRGLPSADGVVFDRHGHEVGTVNGSVALSGKLIDMPGEQLLVYAADGTVSLWYDVHAKDSPRAFARFANPFYSKALSISGNGYNWCILGGI